MLWKLKILYSLKIDSEKRKILVRNQKIRMRLNLNERIEIISLSSDFTRT